MSGIFDYRLKFSKRGPIRFVGHLDVMRYMQKANRRAGLPMRYSEGFSPHQIMSFALPLSVGATSDGEYLDMSLVEEVEPEDIVIRLNGVMNEGIEALSCIRLEERAPKAMTIIAAAGYELKLREGFYTGGDGPFKDRAELKAALEKFLSSDEIIAVKKTKKGEAKIDIKPLIHEYSVGEDAVLKALLHAGSRDHVKPALLYGCFFDSVGAQFDPLSLHVHRLDMYTVGADGGFEALIKNS